MSVDRITTIHSLGATTFKKITTQKINEIISAVNTNDANIGLVSDKLDTLTDNKNIVIAAGVIRPDISGGIGQPITWYFLNADNGDSSHDNLYFTGVSASGSAITITYPTASKVIYGTAIVDDALSGKLVNLGTGVGLSSMEIDVSATKQLGAVLSNNGTTWSSTNGDLSISYNSGTGLIDVTGLPYIVPDYVSSATYAGTNARDVRFEHSGLSNGEVKMFIRDLSSSGAIVTGSPSSSDKIYLTGDLYTSPLQTSVLGSGNSTYWTADSNIWVLAILEI